jgi:transposase
MGELRDAYIAENNPGRVIEVFADQLDIDPLRFEGIEPAVTGRPSYDRAALLKIYTCGYLNRIQSSRRTGLVSWPQIRFGFCSPIGDAQNSK